MEITAVEQRRPVRETPAQKLARESAAFTRAVLRLAFLTIILTPVLLLAFLTADLPLRSFDWLVDEPALKPGLWLSIGGIAMALALPLVILITRRFGGDEASRVVTASWGVAAVLTFAEVTYLGPTLEAADLPSVRYVVAFVASAMLSQYLAIGVYDVTRGGGKWWRPPLFALLFGYVVQTLIYFPAAYIGAPAPWLAWAVSDFAVKCAIAFAFLAPYLVLMKPLRPRGGYGW